MEALRGKWKEIIIRMESIVEESRHPLCKKGVSAERGQAGDYERCPLESRRLRGEGLGKPQRHRGRHFLPGEGGDRKGYRT